MFCFECRGRHKKRAMQVQQHTYTVNQTKTAVRKHLLYGLKAFGEGELLMLMMRASWPLDVQTSLLQDKSSSTLKSEPASLSKVTWTTNKT